MSHGAQLSVIVPGLGPLLTDGKDGTLKVTVRKWLQGGAPRDEVEAQYRPISDWNAPQVTFHHLGLTNQQIATLLECIMSMMNSQQMFQSVTCTVSRGNCDTLVQQKVVCVCCCCCYLPPSSSVPAHAHARLGSILTAVCNARGNISL